MSFCVYINRFRFQPLSVLVCASEATQSWLHFLILCSSLSLLSSLSFSWHLATKKLLQNKKTNTKRINKIKNNKKIKIYVVSWISMICVYEQGNIYIYIYIYIYINPKSNRIASISLDEIGFGPTALTLRHHPNGSLLFELRATKF